MVRPIIRWFSAFFVVSLLAFHLNTARADAACASNAELLTLGQTSYASGDYAGAVDAFTCAILADSANYAAYLGRSQAALRVGRYSMAVNDANIVTDYAPHLVDTALADYTSQINMDGGSVPTFMQRALLYWTLAEDQLVIQDAERIIQLDPQNAFAYLLRGSSNQYLGDRLTPAADFTQALLLDPNNADIHALIGSTYIQTGDAMNGVMHLDQALGIDPANERAYYFRGLVALGESHYADAIADFSRAIAINPQYIDPYYDRGLTYARQANYAQAIGDFDQALRINRDFSLAYLSRGVVYDLTGDEQAAVRDYMHYVTLNRSANVPGQPLTPGTPVSLQMNAGLVYTLPLVAQAGQMVSITATSPNNLADPLIVLLGTDGITVIAGNDDEVTGGYTAAIHDLSLSADGTYTLLVTHSDGGAQGTVNVNLAVQ